MSLYNMLNGVNNMAELLGKALDLDIGGGSYDTGRFRDIWINPEDNTITLFTRNGGGNRESYEDVFDDFETHPNYIEDYDDDFDSTYAHIKFSFPDEYKDELTELAKSTEKQKSLFEKTEDAIDAITKGPDNE